MPWLLPHLAADTVLADQAYDADARVLDVLRAAGKTAAIPPKCNRKEQRPYDRELYKARHLIENFFSKPKQFRAITTRHDKAARNFLAAIYLASTIWLNREHALSYRQLSPGRYTEITITITITITIMIVIVIVISVVQGLVTAALMRPKPRCGDPTVL